MAADYTEKLKELLPPGKAWTRSTTSTAHALHTALAKSFGRVVDRAADLLLEMDPRTVTEMIADWERVYGLPDACAVAPTTLADRRAALTARVISRGGWSGGPSEPFLRSLIVALGYADADIVIRRFYRQPFTCESACTDPMQERDWLFVYEFHIKHGQIDDVAECQVSKKVLAQYAAEFAFPLCFFSDGTFTRSGAAVFVDPNNGNQSALAADELGTIYFGV
jgi:uncharacterized protein YmfQ (DUF2313 family)